jgi:alpha-tubulin suppressor-like RCC1 family protein
MNQRQSNPDSFIPVTWKISDIRTADILEKKNNTKKISYVLPTVKLGIISLAQKRPSKLTMFKLVARLNLAALLVAFFVNLSAPSAQLANAFSAYPRTDTYGVDGIIISQAVGPDGTIYIGGQFDAVVHGPAVGGGLAVDATDATPNYDSRARTNAGINASIPDGNGGWYIGGGFTLVQDTPRNFLAHINSDGTLDEDWDPSLDSAVTTMALDGGTLYVGGSFLNVNTSTTSVARNRLAAFDLVDGTATAWDPSLNSAPTKLIVTADSVYVSGSGFTQANISTTPVSRKGVVQFNKTDGTATSWHPTFGGPGAANASTIAASSDTLYVGGFFSSASDGVNSDNRDSLAAFNLADGTLKGWTAGVTDPDFTFQRPPIYAVAVDASTVYVGGIFETATPSSVTRVNLAAFNVSDGTATSWDPDIAAAGTGNNGLAVHSISLSGSAVYVAGGFSAVNISSVNAPRNTFASFDLTTGAVNSWDPQAICGTAVSSTCDGGNENILVSGSEVFLGTAGTSGINYVGPRDLRNGLAAIDPATGHVTSWDAGIKGGAFGLDANTHVDSLLVSGSTLYIGGSFTSVNNDTTPVNRNGMAALNLSDAQATGWDPDIGQTFVDGNITTVHSMAIAGSTLYAGGMFNTVNGGGFTRNMLAAFNLTDGTATSWDPDVSSDNGPEGVHDVVNSIAISGDTLYAGGHFTTVNGGGVNRNNLAAFNLTDGTATAWDPDVSNSPINDDDWQSAQAGYDATLALKDDGALWSWGCDCSGELGEHSRDSDEPTRVGTDTWISIATAMESDNSMGVKSDGTLWGWGANDTGQLGLGDYNIPHFDMEQVGSDTDWDQVTFGYYHTLALKDDGTLWGWGYNGDYELGLNDTDQRNSPTQIGTDTDWDEIAGGYDHSLAIKTDGTLWSWGTNFDGQLGQGDDTERTVPTQVGSDTDWSEVRAGDSFTIARKNDGTIWSWGSGSNGRLGHGNTTPHDTPTQIGSDTDWVTIGAGDRNAFGIKSDGTLWSWGYNGDGALGVGDNSQKTSPTQVGSDTDWLGAEGGYGHTMAFKTDGTLWGMGDNGEGQLGQSWSVVDDSNIPLEVSRKHGDVIINAIALGRNTLYAGGHFSAVNNSSSTLYRDDVAGFNLNTGAATSFQPDLGPSSFGSWSHFEVTALAATGDAVYVGRTIPVPNPSYTISTGGPSFLPGETAMGFNIYDSSRTPWDPNIDKMNSNVRSLRSIVIDDDDIYVGGQFDHADAGASPTYLANFAAFSDENVPDTPTSLGPTQFVDGSTTTETHPGLTFSLSDPDAGDYVGYQITLSKHSDFSAPVVDYRGVATPDGTATFTVGQAEGLGDYAAGSPGQSLTDGTYYWKVKAYDQDGLGSSFATANGGAIAFIVDNPTLDLIRASEGNGLPTDGDSVGWRSSASDDGRYITFYSNATNILPDDINSTKDVFFYDTQTGEMEMISIASDGTQGNGDSTEPSMSADGRYVAFASNSTNLDPVATNGGYHVYVRDRQTDVTELISYGTGGVDLDPGTEAYGPSMSADGRYVTFSSNSTNLDPNADNGQYQIYLYDRQTGTTELVSKDNLGVQGDGLSDYSAISDDGTIITYYSESTNLADGDTNGVRDVFVYDTNAGTTIRVSVDDLGNEGDGDSDYPSISGNGRYVVFGSASTNLVADDTNASEDVFVYDLQTSTIERISVSSMGDENDGGSWSYSGNAISIDGRYVTFESVGTLLDGTDTNGKSDVYIRDRQNNTTKRLTGVDGGVEGDGDSWEPNISGDGQYVIIETDSGNLDPEDDNGYFDIYISDAFDSSPGLHLTRVTKAYGVEGNGNAWAWHGSMSDDGRYISFYDNANNIAQGDDNNGSGDDVFVFDQDTHKVERISVDSNEVGGNGQSGESSISGDGRYVAFMSNSDNLDPIATSGTNQVYLRDRQAGTTVLISKGAGDTEPDNESYSPSISKDGRYIAYSSTATNITGDATGGEEKIFVYDRIADTTDFVSHDLGGTEGNANSTYPAISGDGSLVAFYSDATNLVPDDTNGVKDVFVYDRGLDTIQRISVDDDGNEGNGDSKYPAISGNGRYVAFGSQATNLVPDDTNGSNDMFLYDLLNDTIQRISVDDDGNEGDGESNSWSDFISDDGRYVSFESEATNLVAGDTNGFWDVFVRDNANGTIQRITGINGGVQGNNNAWESVVSGDGAFVMFDSTATNLIPHDTNGLSDVFLASIGAVSSNSDPTAGSLGPAGYVNGSTGSDNTPTLTFILTDPDVSDTVQYQIQIDDSPSFGSPAVDYVSALGAQGSLSFTVGQSAGSGTYNAGGSGQTLSDDSYYWRVKAIDENSGESSYATANGGSIAFIVDTAVIPPPPPPPPSSGGSGGGGSSTPPADVLNPCTNQPLADLIPAEIIFDKNINHGKTNQDVYYLQKFLNQNGFIVASSGPGSPGFESTTFTDGTRDALRNFQIAFAREIGNNGKSGNLVTPTRNFINSLGAIHNLTCDNGQPTPAPAPAPTPAPAPNPTPNPAPSTPGVQPTVPLSDVSIHFINAVCPTFGDIIGNGNADVADDTYGKYLQFKNYRADGQHFVTPYPAKPINPREIPSACSLQAGLSFKLSTDGSHSNNVTTVGPTGSDGEFVIQVKNLPSAFYDQLSNNYLIWMSEIPQPVYGGYAAFRCYSDALNGDNLEFIQIDKNNAPANVYCIAYNALSDIPNAPTLPPDQQPEDGNADMPGLPGDSGNPDGNDGSDRGLVDSAVDLVGSIVSALNPADDRSASEAFEDAREAARDIAARIPGGATSLNVLSPLLAVSALPFASFFAPAAQIVAGFGSPVDLYLVLVRLFDQLLTVLGLRRKKRYWGMVYDSVSKQPLDPVVVKLVDVKSNKVLETAITDLYGHFGFLIKEHGAYAITAEKKGYDFPSKRLPGDHDQIFDNLYHGEILNIFDDSHVVLPNIPMDPTGYDFNQEAKKKIIHFRPNWEWFKYVIFMLLFWFGFALSALAFVSNPSAVNIIVIALYLAVLAYKLFWPHSRLWGRIVGLRAGDQANLLIELNDPALPGIVMGRAVTASDGKFFLKAKPGKYKVMVKAGENFDQEVSSFIADIGKEGVLNKNVKIKR